MNHELIAPSEMAQHVVAFCASVNRRAKPLRLRVAPRLSGEATECFENVQRHIDAFGGSIVNGWAIWENPQLFIEAEFHAVWKTPVGALTDVNPREPWYREILFLPDPEKVYPGNTVNNIRRALLDHPAVHEHLERAERLFRIREPFPAGVPVAVPTSVLKELKQIASEQDAAREEFLQLMVTHRRDSDPCFCGSLQSFGICHAAELRAIVASNPVGRKS